jgi:hypothetical protein
MHKTAHSAHLSHFIELFEPIFPAVELKAEGGADKNLDWLQRNNGFP